MGVSAVGVESPQQRHPHLLVMTGMHVTCCSSFLFGQACKHFALFPVGLPTAFFDSAHVPMDHQSAAIMMPTVVGLTSASHTRLECP